MLLILPSWTWLVACCLAGVTVVGYPVSSDRGCVLREDSGPLQTKELARLTDLFGGTLMTESNEKTYFVSICRRIPLYGSTNLAGAVQYNSKGEYVVLGEIDKAEFVENENTMVLTYTGRFDGNTNLNEECNGNEWKTSITFICNPYAIDDTLKLVDEDVDQSEICQIKFGIVTSKICRWNPSVVRSPIIERSTVRYQDGFNGMIIPTFAKQPSPNRDLEEIKAELAMLYANLILKYMSDPFAFVVLFLPLVVWQIKQCKKDKPDEKKSQDDQPAAIAESKAPTPAVQASGSVPGQSKRKRGRRGRRGKSGKSGIQRRMYNRETSTSGSSDDLSDSSSVIPNYGGIEKENALRVPAKKKIWKYVWPVAVLVAVTITMLILQIPYMTILSLILLLIWIWWAVKLCKPGKNKKERETNSQQGTNDEEFASCSVNYKTEDRETDIELVPKENTSKNYFCTSWIWRICKLDRKKKEIDENTPLVQVEDKSNEKTAQNQEKNEEESTGVVNNSVEVKDQGLDHQGEKVEEIASRGTNGSTAVLAVDNTLASARISEKTDDATDVSGESKIENENDVHVSKENVLDEKKIDS